MKIKLFLLEYTPYLLIGLSCLLDLEWLDSILIFLFYLILLKEYNRVGFINRMCIMYSLIYGLFLFLNNSLTLFSLRIGILFLILLIYLPCRDKVKNLIKKLPLNIEMSVYYNRIELSDVVIRINFELMEKEIIWLSRQVVLRSKLLKKIEIKFINNEYLGRNYFVNIS